MNGLLGGRVGRKEKGAGEAIRGEGIPVPPPPFPLLPSSLPPSSLTGLAFSSRATTDKLQAKHPVINVVIY